MVVDILAGRGLDGAVTVPLSILQYMYKGE